MKKKLLMIFAGICITIAIAIAVFIVFFFIKAVTTPVKKPVLYLYPTKEQKIDVKLHFDGEITCTYPEYKDGWSVIGKPDGSLLNLDDNRRYSYLFWEGENKSAKWDMSKGFVIEGSKTKDFLQDKLSELGLKENEYNDFITYWLPEMQRNKYNQIYFATDEYEKIAKLDITPKPDSLLRVFMVYRPLDKFIEVEEQKIRSFERHGFCVVEWGGGQIK